MSERLEELRGRLDAIDARIIEALAARQALVSGIGELKLDEPLALRDRAREQDLLARLAAQARAVGLDGYFVTRVFREILDHSLRAQQEGLVRRHNPDRKRSEIVVAYQGGEGAYSHLAATKHFAAHDAAVSCRALATFADVLEAVRDGTADYGMLPIENTTAGSINEAYDLLARMDLALVGEEVLRIEHCLVALEPVPLCNIRRIYSHPQALAQCSEFLRTLSDCHIESFPNTALAAEKVRDERDLSQAAIASQDAAGRYGLHVVRRDIANQRENYTRFVVVAASPLKYDLRIPCKTSLIFATKHEEGALLACLNILAAQHLSLTKLESRPRPNNPWEYLFYVDFEGNLAEPRVQQALRELAGKTSVLKVLGSYPSRTSRETQPVEPRPAGHAPATSADPRSTPGAGGAVEQGACGPVSPSVLQSLQKAPYKLVSRATRLQDTVIRVGPLEVGGAARPIVIAGPCSVESREMILECARVVKEHGGDMLRGGCFKPRTSPYAFQGHGYDALEWLEEAGRAYGLPIVTEVMHPADIEPVARRADVLQLGARNMQNFSLLKELGRIDRPVLLKRGMMSSIDEWLGAAEYILAHGNQQVILCERGIRTFETATRNTLDLAAVPVVRERSHLPIICDPSHAVGAWRWVAPMAVAALAAGAHGVMVEIHPDPGQALSDGPQSLRFERFAEMMQRLQA
ncbi:MAG: 3-deoxy-7-phosphoheptulonate synthase [Phycisphaerae bacterium]|nr:3-deoxy-7-phosphoheptulonate synthase [Phycisphaerae bacterium]MCZ2400348.1 3-deoxy-7-phosphoheptulonate synthase [Phycisphaerae bacterium]